eukprot:2976482-Rhodomonas_salina.1
MWVTWAARALLARGEPRDEGGRVTERASARHGASGAGPGRELGAVFKLGREQRAAGAADRPALRGGRRGHFQVGPRHCQRVQVRARAASGRRACEGPRGRVHALRAAQLRLSELRFLRHQWQALDDARAMR